MYHKFRDLKSTNSLSHSFSGFQKDEIKILARATVLQWGWSSSSKLSGGRLNSFPCHYKIVVPVSSTRGPLHLQAHNSMSGPSCALNFSHLFSPTSLCLPFLLTNIKYSQAVSVGGCSTPANNREAVRTAWGYRKARYGAELPSNIDVLQAPLLLGKTSWMQVLPFLPAA